MIARGHRFARLPLRDAALDDLVDPAQARQLLQARELHFHPSRALFRILHPRHGDPPIYFALELALRLLAPRLCRCRLVGLRLLRARHLLCDEQFASPAAQATADLMQLAEDLAAKRRRVALPPARVPKLGAHPT